MEIITGRKIQFEYRDPSKLNWQNTKGSALELTLFKYQVLFYFILNAAFIFLI
jgi:hypothetical protein